MIKQINRLVVASFVIITVLLATPTSATADEEPCTPSAGFDACVRITHEGANQTFTVPDGVDELDVKLWGAGGGGGLFLNFGGHGAFGSANHDAEAGDSYTIIVGIRLGALNDEEPASADAFSDTVTGLGHKKKTV